jgi:hypothetical protein
LVGRRGEAEVKGRNYAGKAIQAKERKKAKDAHGFLEGSCMGYGHDYSQENDGIGGSFRDCKQKALSLGTFAFLLFRRFCEHGVDWAGWVGIEI